MIPYEYYSEGAQLSMAMSTLHRMKESYPLIRHRCSAASCYAEGRGSVACPV